MDDRPQSRRGWPEYNNEHFVAADWIDGTPIRIAIRTLVHGGQLRRVCIGFQMLRGERWTEFVRYDDAHGHFHRHAPGIPPNPLRRELIAVDRGKEITYALHDLRANGTQYFEAAVTGEFEILEDAEDEGFTDT